MNKKKRIIIVSICLGVILIGTIIGIIIATRKKFDIEGNINIQYNNHTSMDVVSVPQGYTDSNSYYSNATILTQKTETGKLGVYSYIENEIIVPAEYSSGNIGAISIMTDNAEFKENVFRAIGDEGQIDYYNDQGTRLKITEFNSEEKQNYGFIKERKISVAHKRAGIKVKTSNEFNTKKVAITSAEFNVAYIKEGVYNYERWTLTDTDGNTYDNLYKVTCGQRELVQTLNNYTGSNIESSMTGENLTYIDTFENLTPIYFLKDGTPMLIQTTINQVNNNGMGIIELTIYDIYFNIQNTAQIAINENLYNLFRVGNSVFLQYKIPASEKKYDFYEADEYLTSYYKLETYRLNLNTGKYSEVAFKYLVDEYNDNFNMQTLLTHARQIKNKTLQPSQLILINDSLQTKVIDYEFNYLTKITSDKYIAHSDNGDYLINDKYDRICFLGNYDNFFTTKEAIILSSTDDGYSYVCDMKGTIIRRYLNNEIENIHDDTYYLVKELKEDENGNRYTAKYLERLGVRHESPIGPTQENTEYIFNNTTYCAYSDDILADGIGIITRVKEDIDGSFIYDFYNIKGELLRSVSGLDTKDKKLVLLEEFDDYYLVYISSKGILGYTMVLDK